MGIRLAHSSNSSLRQQLQCIPQTGREMANLMREHAANPQTDAAVRAVVYNFEKFSQKLNLILHCSNSPADVNQTLKVKLD